MFRLCHVCPRSSASTGWRLDCLVSSAAPGSPRGTGDAQPHQVPLLAPGLPLSLLPATLGLATSLLPSGCCPLWASQLGFQDTWLGVSEGQAPEAGEALGWWPGTPQCDLVSRRALSSQALVPCRCGRL